jgi:7-carboxy-7-deazaguanine synthase
MKDEFAGLGINILSTGSASENRLEIARESVTAIAARLAPIRDRAAGSLVVHEIYLSLQGESTWAGWPCVFVRLTACQLRCNYCDTVHAFNTGTQMLLEDVFQQVLAYDCPMVELTGGEPLLQDESYELMKRLCDAGKRVLIETSGAIATNRTDPRVHVILDVKTPGSGEAASMDWTNLERLKPIDEVKFVICDRRDFDWSIEVVDRYKLTEKCPVHFSACHGRVGLEELATWILQSKRNIRFQIQLHKVIWGAETRGV